MYPGLGAFVFLFIGSVPFLPITAERNHAYRIGVAGYVVPTYSVRT